MERRLRRRKEAIEEARREYAEAVSDAVSLSGTLGHEGGSRSSMPGDPTGRGADRILRAGERIRLAEAWETVMRQADEDFPPETVEGQIAQMHYQARMSMAAIARLLNYERQTIVRRNDIYVQRVAWYAAKGGLLDGQDRAGAE